MSTTEQASDQEVVVGQVAGIIQKRPGQDGQPRWQIEVAIEGSQYTRKLWTKDAEFVGQMGMMIGQSLSFMCGVSNWTMNDGTPVRSLWVNGYGVAGAVAPQPAQQAYTQVVPTSPGPQPASPQTAAAPQVPAVQATPVPQAPPPSTDLREEKIHRQTASKVAVQLLKHLKPEDQTFTTLITLSERLVSYYDNGVSWPATNGDPGPEPGDPGLSHDDDKIPF